MRLALIAIHRLIAVVVGVECWRQWPMADALIAWALAVDLRTRWKNGKKIKQSQFVLTTVNFRFVPKI